MDENYNNPLGMKPDPYNGSSFVLPETNCTAERQSWFRRNNDIIGFAEIDMAALNEFATKYRNHFVRKGLGPETPIKFVFSDGRSLTMPTDRFYKISNEGIEVLCRQGFLMLYGSLETYLFELFERSYPQIGINENILDRSIKIMRTKQWDGKFCKMGATFTIDYKCSELIDHFKSFPMQIDDNIFTNPLLFLDQLAQIRHRIVHASSILEKGRLLFININRLRDFYAYCVLLTGYVDDLFARRFGYIQANINPAGA